MSCPVLSPYIKSLSRVGISGLLEENPNGYTAQLSARESALDTCNTVTRLRAFYLARCLCMLRVQEVMALIHTQLEMNQEGADGLYSLAKKMDQSWSGLSIAINGVEELTKEVAIEYAGVCVSGNDPAAPMLKVLLLRARTVLVDTSAALRIVREGLNKGELPCRLGVFVALVLGIEKELDVPLRGRLQHAEDMLSITLTNTVIPEEVWYV